MPTEAALRLECASVVFDGFKALDIDHFEVQERVMRVVIGPNGAGKTTLCDVISGKTRLHTGQVFLGGDEVSHWREFEIARRGVGRKFQTPSVFGSLTVLENLELAGSGPRRAAGSSRGVWRRRPAPAAPETTTLQLGEVLDQIGLSAAAGTQAQFLSHGQRQALEIGMLLVAGARLLLLDEPAAGLSDEETEKMCALLRDLAGQRTLLVIEHDMDFVRQLGAEITVLNEGSILAEGPMHVIQSDPRVVEAYLGR